MMLSRSSGVMRLGMNLNKVVGRCRSRSVLQVGSSRNSRQDW